MTLLWQVPLSSITTLTAVSPFVVSMISSSRSLRVQLLQLLTRENLRCQPRFETKGTLHPPPTPAALQMGEAWGLLFHATTMFKCSLLLPHSSTSRNSQTPRVEGLLLGVSLQRRRSAVSFGDL